MDRIEIKRLKIFAHHGVYEEEAENGQNFYVSIIMEMDTRGAGKTDDLDQSVDYGSVSQFVDAYVKGRRFKLLEALAENLARELLLKYTKLDKVTVRISKPQAPIPLPFEDVSVTIERQWHIAYLAIGSSMGDREHLIQDAIEQLENEQDVFVLRTSEMIETKPYGGVATEVFLNGAIKVRTLLTPYELLDVCHRIEDALGRVRTERWGDRTMDLDILFYDDMVMDDDYLTIPHIDMKNRGFVLQPMAEIAPGFIHPVYRKSMTDMLSDLADKPQE